MILVPFMVDEIWVHKIHHFHLTSKYWKKSVIELAVFFNMVITY